MAQPAVQDRNEAFGEGIVIPGESGTFNSQKAGVLYQPNYRPNAMGTGPADLNRVLPGPGGKPMMLPTTNGMSAENLGKQFKFKE
ncbi:MAG TPA: hypothetical protein VGR89_08885 [Puia sp.]|nr:hypothetical protein [Puia sp.]